MHVKDKKLWLYIIQIYLSYGSKDGDKAGDECKPIWPRQVVEVLQGEPVTVHVESRGKQNYVECFHAHWNTDG